MPEIIIRGAAAKDQTQIKELCVNTIRTSCAQDYSPEQLEVWMSAASRRDWARALESQYFIIAELDNEIVGFGAIEQGEFISFLYVSGNHLKKGIASKIFDNLMTERKKYRKKNVRANVSKTAKGFFLKKGFYTERVQKNILDGVDIENFRMVKQFG